MRIVRECKVTGGETLPSEHADGCVKLAKDGVDGQGGGGGGGTWLSLAHCEHLALVAQGKKTKKKKTCIPTTPLPALITTTPPPPSIFSLSHRPASAKTIVL